ncbi:MAG: hypothetical protein ITG00_05080 [Flavobacterium sp.]|nr:hypothetical protein [Flavobacterium sp.]
MKTVLLTLVLFVCNLLSAQQFEKGMGHAFELWGQGKNAEASAMFERIASAEPNSWLPNYYVALVNTTTAFQTKDKAQVTGLLTKAQQVLDIEMDKNPANAELLVMQAMIHTAWVAYDPMTNAMALSPKVMELYEKAAKLAPENPRVVLGKAEFEIGGARYFGSDIAPMCEQINKSIELFANFKPETPLHPKWGLDRAQLLQAECKK